MLRTPEKKRMRNTNVLYGNFDQYTLEKGDDPSTAAKQNRRAQSTIDNSSDNYWDAQNFSSVDNRLPIYPRRTGFVNFAQQTKRPDPASGNANDNRFLSLN